jgi:hypothetical protein
MGPATGQQDGHQDVAPQVALRIGQETGLKALVQTVNRRGSPLRLLEGRPDHRFGDCPEKAGVGRSVGCHVAAAPGAAVRGGGAVCGSAADRDAVAGARAARRNEATAAGPARGGARGSRVDDGPLALTGGAMPARERRCVGASSPNGGWAPSLLTTAETKQCWGCRLMAAGASRANRRSGSRFLPAPGLPADVRLDQGDLLAHRGGAQLRPPTEHRANPRPYLRRESGATRLPIPPTLVARAARGTENDNTNYDKKNRKNPLTIENFRIPMPRVSSSADWQSTETAAGSTFLAWGVQ